MDTAVPAPAPADVPRVRRLTRDPTGRWLAAGWADLRRSPAASLAPGCAVAAAGWALIAAMLLDGRFAVLYPLLGGFLLVGPALAVGLYEISRRHEAGEPVTLFMTLSAVARNPLPLILMGLLLAAIGLAWIRIASILFALEFGTDAQSAAALVSGRALAAESWRFLVATHAAGGLLAAIVFAISAVSLPMLLDRDVDLFTAIGASLRACAANPRIMLGWALVILLLTLAGLATLMLGLVVVVPLLGHATWHAYTDLVMTERPAPHDDPPRVSRYFTPHDTGRTGGPQR